MKNLIRTALAVTAAPLLVVAGASAAQAAYTCSGWHYADSKDHSVSVQLCQRYRPGPVAQAQGQTTLNAKVNYGTISRHLHVDTLSPLAHADGCVPTILDSHISAVGSEGPFGVTVPAPQTFRRASISTKWYTLVNDCTHTSYSDGTVAGMFWGYVGPYVLNSDVVLSTSDIRF
jgi:hypothetical protein